MSDRSYSFITATPEDVYLLEDLRTVVQSFILTPRLCLGDLPR